MIQVSPNTDCRGTSRAHGQTYFFCLLSVSQVNSRQTDRHKVKDICSVPAGYLHTHTASLVHPGALRSWARAAASMCQQPSHKDSQCWRKALTFNEPNSSSTWGSVSPLGSICIHSLSVPLAGVPVPSPETPVQRTSLCKFSHLLIVSSVDVHSAIL